MTTKRTDPHRPGAIIPAEYKFVLWYAISHNENGWFAPAVNVNCELENRSRDTGENGKHTSDTCCMVALRRSAKFSEYGAAGACTICGTPYIYGEVWKHLPTGEHINVGHICAEKYGLLKDRSEIELLRDRRAAAKAAYLIGVETRERKARFLAANPGLEEALKVEHYIVSDIAARFNRYDLSEKQVALVLKIANEVKNPPEAEKHVPAPTGRVTFTGKIVSVKTVESAYSRYGVTKIVVKVETPEGSWLVWMTAPSGLYPTGNNGLKGHTITATATLTPGRDAHFAFGKRPSKATLHEEVAA